MEIIDLATWPRKSHFEYFDRAEYPYIDLTVQMDITAFLPLVKKRGYKFYPSLLYCFSHGFNAIDEFKYRIVGRDVVRYDHIDVNTTVPIEGERFAFCTIPFKRNIRDFLKEAETVTDAARKQTVLAGDDRFDVAWVSCNPWFSFTSMTAPTADKRMRSIPVILAGKYFESGGKVLLPLSLKVNHALIDGLHIGKLLGLFQDSFNDPDTIFGESAYAYAQT